MNSIWDIINIPMGYVIRFCNMICGNQYILALLVFAVIVEVIFLPFSIKQQKNSIKQAKLRPKEMAIRKKYAGRTDRDSQQKMSMEIQEFYQKEGFNPMGGCLPLLIQFPIIIALYNMVLNPLHYICGFSNAAIGQISTIVSSFTGKEYVAARNIDLLGDLRNVIVEHGTGIFSTVEGGFKYTSVSQLPKFSMFGGAINLAETPNLKVFNWLLLVPILTFLAYFLSMKLTRKLTYQPPMGDDKAAGCSNTMMDLMMPLMSVFISFSVPAAIGVYWIFKSLIGIGKQAILRVAMPVPQFTEQDYKKAEKEMNARPERVNRNPSGKKVRSLHHIDDDDYADTSAPKKPEALKKAESDDTASEKKGTEETKSTLIAAAPIKDDAPRKDKADKADKKEKKHKKADRKKDGADDNSDSSSQE